VTLRLLSYNIRYGGAGREQALAAVIRAARSDVVVLQEATKPDVIAQLARDTGFEHWGARRGESLGVLSRVSRGSRDMPSSRSCPRACRGQSSAFI
jgi:exodeoxyribonuclease-3